MPFSWRTQPITKKMETFATEKKLKKMKKKWKKTWHNQNHAYIYIYK